MNKILRLLVTTSFALIYLFTLSASTVSALDIGNANPCDAGYVNYVDAEGRSICQPIGEVQNPTETNAWDLARSIINILLIATGSLAVIMIIISAFQITTSAGEAEKVKKAKSTLMWAVIGLILALLATVIVNVVVDFANRL